jgi:hypothetical protein
MTEQEYLDSKNIVTEYVEDFTDRNGWKNISLTTLLKDYKKQLTLTDVGCQREQLLKSQKDYLMLNTKLSVEQIVDFIEVYKNF